MGRYAEAEELLERSHRGRAPPTQTTMTSSAFELCSLLSEAAAWLSCRR
jgi:hypothetical protein